MSLQNVAPDLPNAQGWIDNYGKMKPVATSTDMFNGSVYTYADEMQSRLDRKNKDKFNKTNFSPLSSSEQGSKSLPLFGLERQMIDKDNIFTGTTHQYNGLNKNYYDYGVFRGIEGQSVLDTVAYYDDDGDREVDRIVQSLSWCDFNYKLTMIDELDKEEKDAFKEAQRTYKNYQPTADYTEFGVVRENGIDDTDVRLFEDSDGDSKIDTIYTYKSTPEFEKFSRIYDKPDLKKHEQSGVYDKVNNKYKCITNYFNDDFTSIINTTEL